MEFIGKNWIQEKNCERVAARAGLSFHIYNGKLYRYSGHESGPREVTKEEQEMWDTFCPPDMDNLVSTPEEIESSFQHKVGPFTIGPKDLAVLRNCKAGFFDHNISSSDLRKGFFGKILNGIDSHIYVSKMIPVGFYYEGPRIEELHWVPSTIEPKELKPEISDEIKTQVFLGLKPFIKY
jgi:hypothetical protein